ncbi:S-layer homology domain-containing protein [Paenibacillus sp. GCM10027628]|uniref:S-layer homology domain-containing protein n=1 Tax=Paenibacillus sp. GCM10027628 TaxID=3273413 RepID=UPI00363B13A2
MKLLSKKWTSIALVLSMLVALLLPLTVNAASTINITNLVTHVDPLDTATDSAVQRFTQNPINITADISGFSADQISSIYYEIVNVNTGVTASNTVNKPVLSSTNSTEITFNNVQLSEGLNKITLKYGASSAVASLPGWAYFTPVANISNLQVNGATFADNGTYPTQAPYSNVIITGSAPNATEVSATVAGTTYSASAFTNGNFTFIANSGRSSDMTFSPGDNLITFIAKNLTNSYTTQKPFVYDNGKAFAYNANVLAQSAASTTVQNLYTVPTVNKNSNDNVTVKASIKNPISSGTATDYVYMDVTVLGLPNFKIHYDFTQPGAAGSNPAISGGLNPNVATTPTNTTISNNAGKSTSAYNIYDFSSDLPVNTNSSYQQVLFTFVNAGGVPTQTTYTYYFLDPNVAYTDHVAQQFTSTNGTTSYEVNLNASGSSSINQFPAALNIYTNSKTSSIKVQVGGSYYNDATSTDYDSTNKVYKTNATTIKDAQGNFLNKTTVNLQGIQDGPTTLTIIPYDSTGNSSPAGIKQYNVNIASSPYVIVTNLFNGKVVSNPGLFSCPGSAAGSGPCVSGRLVNLPYSEYKNVKLTVNDNPIPLQVQSAASPATGDMIFKDGTFIIPKSAFNTVPATNPASTYFDASGKKSIKFNLYLNGQLVTSTNIDVFVLSDASPLISTFMPTQSPNAPTAQFTPGTLPDSYTTNASELQLKGTISNVDISVASGTSTTSPSSKWSLTVTAPGGTPTPLSVSMVVGSFQQDQTDLKKFTEDFKLSTPYVLPSGVYGDFVFQLNATNASGVTTNKTVTITRQPVAYVVIQPSLLIKNASNQDQANINSNYQNIIIQADNADSVLFGKTAGTLVSGTTNQFQFEATNLKAGSNVITFVVNRGTTKTNGTLVLNNQNAAIEGAQFKSLLNSKMNVFNGKMQLAFPAGTKLMRNDFTQSVDNQFITSDRKLLFGIASMLDGRVDKTVENSSTPGASLLIETSGRFKPASQRYWIDAGSIPYTSLNNANQLQPSLTGSGTLPNSTGGQQFYNRGYTDQVVPTQSGQLTLSFDQSIRADSSKYIAVFQYGTFLNPGDPTIINNTANQQQKWVNLGGVVNTKNNTITVPITSFGYFQVMYMDNSFTDVTNHAWARDDLDTLYSKGYMQNKVTGLFMPDDPISRGEFVTMLVNAIGIPLINTDTSTNITSPTDPNYSGTFGDIRRGVANPLYDFMHIEAAARAGLIRGAAQGVFLPNNSISRQDAAVIIARAMELKLTSTEQASLAALQKQFTDAGSVDIYAVQSVEAVAKAGFIQGVPNALLPGQKKATSSFDPTGTFTRAQAAEVTIRILQKLKKV